MNKFVKILLLALIMITMLQFPAFAAPGDDEEKHDKLISVSPSGKSSVLEPIEIIEIRVDKVIFKLIDDDGKAMEMNQKRDAYKSQLVFKDEPPGFNEAMQAYNAGNFAEVNPEQSFTALMSDAEHEAVKRRLAAGLTHRAVRGRTVRMFTGLIACDCCGGALTYKTFQRSNVVYLRCGRVGCPKNSKSINVEQVFAVLQYALSEHAKDLLPILQRPKTDPPEVMVIKQQIEVLQTVPGTEELIESKRQEINHLRSADTETPAWLLIGLMRSPTFWLQDQVRLNNVLRLMLDSVRVDLGESIKTAKVVSVKCRAAPADAPLPDDQHNIFMRRGLGDLALAAHHQESIERAMKALG